MSAPRPKWDPLLICVSGMVLTYVWRLHYLLPGPFLRLRPVVLVSAGALVLYLIDTDRRRSLAHLNHPVIKLLLALVLVMALSIPGSLWPGASFGLLRADFAKTVIFFFLLAASIRALIDIERLAGVYVAGGALYALKVVLGSSRHGLGGYDPNDYSLILVCALPLAVYFVARSRSSFARILATIALLLMTAAVVKSGSRSGFIGLLAIGIYLLIAYRALSLKLRVGAVVVSLAGLLFVASDSYWERMSTLLNPQEDYNWSGQSYGGRMEIWKRGIGYMLQRPFLGVGLGSFRRAEGGLSVMAERWRPEGRGFKWSEPHNSFVEVGAELGFTGLIVFLLLIYEGFRALVRVARPPPPGRRRSGRAAVAMAQALIAALIGYIVVGFFLSHAYTTVLYSILGIVVGMTKVTSGTGAAPRRTSGRVNARLPRSRALQSSRSGPSY
jgi:O-antigen ligase